MKKNKKDAGIDSKDLPQSEVFIKKQVYQHPQPADSGKPLKPKDTKQYQGPAGANREEEKTSKEQGLNEEKNDGSAGAFEGLENMEE